MRKNPFYRSLNLVETAGGAEKSLAVLNFTLGLAFVYATKILWLPIPFAFMHIFLRWLTKKDPFIRKSYIKYNRMSDRLDPWPSQNMKKAWRPEGFCRGIMW
ncbi:MAG: VirB3 family type IV secretion system protein [Pseudomonadota bacterium]|nr:VirB3 family type IV secretion system protein [Pseudomonadota bacterium]